MPQPTSSCGKRNATELDAGFRAFAISQVRLFLFVGHDSMSSTILLYIASSIFQTQAPSHRFGPSTTPYWEAIFVSLPSLLAEQPQLLGSLPYTTAVIKEAAPAFPARFGNPARRPRRRASLARMDARYPTENTLIWILHTAMHRVAENWVSPDALPT